MSPYLGAWSTPYKVTFVTLRNLYNVLENIILVTLKETLGLVPMWYCVIQSYNREFESLLMLALHYLPKAKFCICPEDETL